MRKSTIAVVFIVYICFVFVPQIVFAQSTTYNDPLQLNIGFVNDAKNSQAVEDADPVIEKPQPFQEIEVIGEGPRYTIGPGDILQIMVRNQPDFSGRYVVNGSGFIQYNWVGDIEAAGFTKEELKVTLREQLVQFVKFPEVSVIILEYRSKFVYVLGNINRPGKYAMKGDNLTLREAVIMAGLPQKETAALRRTRIIRETEEGPKAIKVNLKAILMEGKLDQNYDLMPGDIVVVPQSRFHTGTTWFSKLISPLFQALAVYEIGFGSDDDGMLN